MLRDLLHGLIAQSAESGPGAFVSMAPFLLMLVVAYFLIWRPQAQQQKKQQEFIDQLKKGDEVLLQGGLFAKIFEVRTADVTVELGSNKVRVLKSGISGPATPAAATASKGEAEKKS